MRPWGRKECEGICFSKAKFVSLAIVNFKTPMNKLPFKTSDVQDQRRLLLAYGVRRFPNVQNLPIRKLEDSAQLLELFI